MLYIWDKPEIGSVCECQKGKLGIVLKINDDNSVEGINFLGKPQQSKKPKLIAICIYEYLNDLAIEIEHELGKQIGPITDIIDKELNKC